MQQTYQFHWKRYQRTFENPLRTAYGDWQHRDGIVIRIIDEAGRSGFGEMAPLEPFGCEPLQDCIELCHAFGPIVDRGELEAATLPTARFAIGSALAMIDGLKVDLQQTELACLLPAGEGWRDVIDSRLESGWRVFKRKVLRDLDDWEAVEPLLQRLRAGGAKLRLDANASWSEEACAEWLKRLAPYASVVDFVEQPLAKGAEARMAKLMQNSPIQIALDESLVGIDSVEHWLAWNGPLVVKPAISGHPLVLRQLLKRRHGRVVLSSALETRIGAYGALLTAGHGTEPLGFGVECWALDDPLGLQLNGPEIDPETLSAEALAAIWSLIGNSSSHV